VTKSSSAARANERRRATASKARKALREGKRWVGCIVNIFYSPRDISMTCGAAQCSYMSKPEAPRRACHRFPGNKKMRNSSVDAHGAGVPAAFGLGRLSQQILNMLDYAGTRAAERRELAHLDRHLLEDIGLTPADVEIGLQDLYANDFRVATLVAKRAA
jgi:hypothetical protein